MASRISSTEVGLVFCNVSDNIILSDAGDCVTNYLDAGAVTNSLLRFYRVRLIP